MKHMVKFSVIEGLDPQKLVGHLKCQDCIHAKTIRQSFKKISLRHAKEILDLVHTDVAGPFNIESVGQNCYFILFIDDATHYVDIYLMQHKSEVLVKFQEYKAKAENLHGRKIKVLRSDNGGEYTGNEFRNFCKLNRIEQQFTVPGTPEQNGMSE